MAKIDLNYVKGGFNLSQINANFDKIENTLNDKVLFRDNPEGEPNQMESDLDMNGNRIYNLPAPVLEHEPARKKDIEDFIEIIGSRKTLRVLDKDIPPFPEVAVRRNKLVSFDENGNPTVQFPSDDSATQLRSELLAPTGANLIGFNSPKGPVQTVQDHLDMMYYGISNIRDPQFEGGAVGDWDGVTGKDDTNAIQAAFASGSRFIHVPSVDAGKSYRITSTINVTQNIRVVGSGVSPYTLGIGTRGPGSWLNFDHSGKGFLIKGTSFLSGVSFEGIGTLRNQPAITDGWQPNDHDYDFFIDNSDVLLFDITLLNPTRGIFLTNGDAGRLEVNTLRAHAFKTLLKVELSYDVVKLHNVHQWPFWSDDPRIHAYTLQNLDVLHFERTDNPMLTNIFTIFARSGIRFSQNSTGKTSKFHLTNADFDRGNYGLWVDNSVINGVTGQFVNITYQWEGGLAGSTGVFIQGNYSELDFVNTRFDGSSGAGIEVGGLGNKINLSGKTTVRFYNQSSEGKPAILSHINNFVNIDGSPDISQGGLGLKYGGLGVIDVNEWRDYVPQVSSESGNVGQIVQANGQFKRYGNSVEVSVDIIFGSISTGSGSIIVTVPNTALNPSVGVGRDLNTGPSLTSTINAGMDTMRLRRFDNSYPQVTGSRLVAGISYRI